MYLLYIRIVLENFTETSLCPNLNPVLTRPAREVPDVRRPLRQSLPGCRVRLPGDLLDLVEA